MLTGRGATAAVCLLMVMALSAGCSGGGSSTDRADGDTTTVAGSDETEGNGDGSCGELDVTGEVDGESFTAAGAVAVSIEDGKAYTVYIGDFPLAPDDVSSMSIPAAPEGRTMFTVANTVFNAQDPAAVEQVAVGDDVAWTPDFGVRTFRVTATTGETNHGNNADAEGTLTVTAVGEEFCGTVDYSDGEKTLQGTFVAPVKTL